MDWSKYGELSAEWTKKTSDYVSGINAFVARGMASNWEDAGEAPTDQRDGELWARVADVVREANAQGAWQELRQHFAPALDVAASPDRRFFALLHSDHLVVTEGWAGKEHLRAPRPRGDEGVPAGVETLSDDDGLAPVEGMAVLPSGEGVVLATSRGIFLCTAERVLRLSPDADQLSQRVSEWTDDEPYPLRTDMTHVAVHRDGDLIACGYQDSQHELRSLDGTLLGAFGPLHSEYPHHAAFSPDGLDAIFNSCHLYNGATSVGRVEELRTLRLPEYEEDVRLLPLEAGSRVYDWNGSAT